MSKKKSKITATILLIAMLFMFIPVSAFASEDADVFTVSLTSPANGTLEFMVNGEVASGSSLQFSQKDEVVVKATPDDGYDISTVGYWKENSSSISSAKQNADGTYYFSMPASNVEVGASFQSEDDLQLGSTRIYEPGTSSNELTASILGKDGFYYDSIEKVDLQVKLDERFFEEGYADDGLTFAVEFRSYNFENKTYRVAAKQDYTIAQLVEMTHTVEDNVYVYEMTLPITRADALHTDYVASGHLEISKDDGSWTNAKGEPITKKSDATDKQIIEATDEALVPTVFLYNLGEKSYHGKKLRTLLDGQGITFVDITKENMGQNLGYMAGWPEYLASKVSDEDAFVDEEYSFYYILKANLSEQQDDEVMVQARELNLNYTQSILTDWGAQKSFDELTAHMQKESQAFSAAMKLGLLIGEIGKEMQNGHDADTTAKLKTAYDMAIEAYTDEEEHESEYYQDAYDKVLNIYLDALGKIQLAGELELTLTDNGDGTYTVTPVIHRNTGDEDKNFEVAYRWKNSTGPTTETYTVPQNQLSSVNLTLSGINKTYGSLYARLQMPTEPEFSVSAGKTSVSVTVQEIVEPLNMPEVEKYVVALYQGKTLIAEKELNAAGTVAFDGLTRNTDYTVEVYAENVVGYSNIADTTVKTKSSSSSSGSSSSSSSSTSSGSSSGAVTPDKDTIILTIGSNGYTINNTTAAMDVVPYIDGNDRTIVPVRFIAEAMGCNVVYNNDARTVTITKGADTCVLTIDSNKYVLNGQTYTMDTQAKIVADRTMVPIRFVTEALGGEVVYSNNQVTITIE